jgi:hypothetical protein
VRPLSFTVRGTCSGNSEASAFTSVVSEDPLFPRRAGEAIRFFDLTHCQCSARKAAVARRCGSGSIGVSSFGGCPSFGVGAARRRAAEAVPGSSGAFV